MTNYLEQWRYDYEAFKCAFRKSDYPIDNISADRIITYTAASKLPEGNQGIRRNAFNTTIQKHTFSNGVGTIVFASTLTTIGSEAFRNSPITSIILPDSVTSIGRYSFAECYSLKTCLIPNSVTTIGERAFYDSNLESIVIPDSVTYIDDSAFKNCTKAETLIIGNSVLTIEDNAFNRLISVRSIIIPNSVTTLGQEAFKECYRAESIIIPNSIDTIYQYTFADCTACISINVPDSVTTIETGAFRYVNNVIYTGSGDISEGFSKCINGYIDGYLAYEDSTKTSLEGCASSAPKEIVIPDTVTSISNVAFDYCNNYHSIKCLAINPPVLTHNISALNLLKIYVPAESVDTYKLAQYWSNYAGIIEAILD